MRALEHASTECLILPFFVRQPSLAAVAFLVVLLWAVSLGYATSNWKTEEILEPKYFSPINARYSSLLIDDNGTLSFFALYGAGLYYFWKDAAGWHTDQVPGKFYMYNRDYSSFYSLVSDFRIVNGTPTFVGLLYKQLSYPYEWRTTLVVVKKTGAGWQVKDIPFPEKRVNAIDVAIDSKGTLGVIYVRPSAYPYGYYLYFSEYKNGKWENDLVGYTSYSVYYNNRIFYDVNDVPHIIYGAVWSPLYVLMHARRQNNKWEHEALLSSTQHDILTQSTFLMTKTGEPRIVWYDNRHRLYVATKYGNRWDIDIVARNLVLGTFSATLDFKSLPRILLSSYKRHHYRHPIYGIYSFKKDENGWRMEDTNTFTYSTIVHVSAAVDPKNRPHAIVIHSGRLVHIWEEKPEQIVAVASSSKPEAFVDEPITFSSARSFSSVGNIVRYDWNFGDGTFKSTSVPFVSHVYKGEGPFTVTLTVTDDKNARDSNAQQIFPYKLLQILGVSASDTQVDSNTAVTVKCNKDNVTVTVNVYATDAAGQKLLPAMISSTAVCNGAAVSLGPINKQGVYVVSAKPRVPLQKCLSPCEVTTSFLVTSPPPKAPVSETHVVAVLLVFVVVFLLVSRLNSSTASY
jgi:PKD repeat protein